jgi:hypothetical protein
MCSRGHAARWGHEGRKEITHNVAPMVINFLSCSWVDTRQRLEDRERLFCLDGGMQWHATAIVKDNHGLWVYLQKVLNCCTWARIIELSCRIVKCEHAIYR